MTATSTVFRDKKNKKLMKMKTFIYDWWQCLGYHSSIDQHTGLGSKIKLRIADLCRRETVVLELKVNEKERWEELVWKSFSEA